MQLKHNNALVMESDTTAYPIAITNSPVIVIALRDSIRLQTSFNYTKYIKLTNAFRQELSREMRGNLAITRNKDGYLILIFRNKPALTSPYPDCTVHSIQTLQDSIYNVLEYQTEQRNPFTVQMDAISGAKQNYLPLNKLQHKCYTLTPTEN
ncbi:hypothetical protein J6590_056799 [Homalodisca vitripennis]|nr:hypothetical protein J6590_056799 [Homalodisca vitripennis]